MVVDVCINRGNFEFKSLFPLYLPYQSPAGDLYRYLTGFRESRIVETRLYPRDLEKPMGVLIPINLHFRQVFDDFT